MSTTSNSLSCEDIPTDRLSFLVKCGSSLAALRRKLNQRNTKEVRIIDNRNIVDEIKRLKEEVKTAKESLIPSYSLDKRGGDKVIEKFEGILNDLIAVDRKNKEHYEELLEELEEMKDNRGLNLDSHKQTSGGTNGGGLSYSSQVLPFDDNFMEAFNKLPSTQRERLLCCRPFAKLYTRDDIEVFIPHNVGISKGVLINWLIGVKIIDDPLEGEQFIEALLADPSFKVISDYRSSRIIISPDFAWSLSLLNRDEEYQELKDRGNVCLSLAKGRCLYYYYEGTSDITSPLITVNNRVYRIHDDMIRLREGPSLMHKRVVVHFGNFHSGMDYVVADDTFSSAFHEYLKDSKDIRFLSLRGISRIPELPRSVCEVSELKVLDLRSCQDLKSLPNDIGRLIKLVYLDLSECYQLNHIPKSIAKLTNLRVLLGFIVVNLQPKDPMHRFAEFDDLKHLTRLIKLTIRTRRMSFPTNEDLQTLNSMQELRKLKVAWVQSFVVQSTTTADAPCLDTQELPKTLEKLELQAASDTTASQLLELISNKRSHNHRLEKLYVRGGNLQKLYPDQHCFPQVKILHLRYLHQLHMRWNDFQLSFPNLSYLRIAECPNLFFFPCNEKGEWIQSESSW